MANTKAIVLQETANNLNTLLKAKVKALPKGFNETRFLQNCMTVLQDTRNIEKCNSVSVARTMLKGAFLGLDFFSKECYAIPYNDYKTGKCHLEFQTDYKGERKLMKQYSVRAIKDIYAKVVREGDEFEEIIEKGIPTINFRPKPFSNEKIIGVFAVVLFEDGGLLYETMSAEDVEKIKVGFAKRDKEGNYSKAWTATPEEMYKKTVIRRLRKSVELEFDSVEQQKTYEEASEFDVKSDEEVKEEASPFENVDFEEVEEGSTIEAKQE
ncbi:recombinase RecT [Clostridium botulinum]|uniref:recombinase RecT n=1 Tax=Clostridium botulinum TaxID=1491 RepID=UPI000581D1C6|nr:RecT family recombinase [Clostridium botulinum]KEI76544.1 recombinase [Clostridium botulinum B2 128]KEI90225.1 recombinase [Clostridium botulinum B2 433]NFI43101.1 recombinase [Clostridium botulinum]NFI76205.1 recombinase [Clostridium botulinum]NFI83454.1 recombinase [Clostridium botulinum]